MSGGKQPRKSLGIPEQPAPPKPASRKPKPAIGEPKPPVASVSKAKAPAGSTTNTPIDPLKNSSKVAAGAKTTEQAPDPIVVEVPVDVLGYRKVGQVFTLGFPRMGGRLLAQNMKVELQEPSGNWIKLNPRDWPQIIMTRLFLRVAGEHTLRVKSLDASFTFKPSSFTFFVNELSYLSPYVLSDAKIDTLATPAIKRICEHNKFTPGKTIGTSEAALKSFLKSSTKPLRDSQDGNLTKTVVLNVLGRAFPIVLAVEIGRFNPLAVCPDRIDFTTMLPDSNPALNTEEESHVRASVVEGFEEDYIYVHEALLEQNVCARVVFTEELVEAILGTHVNSSYLWLMFREIDVAEIEPVTPRKAGKTPTKPSPQFAEMVMGDEYLDDEDFDARLKQKQPAPASAEAPNARPHANVDAAPALAAITELLGTLQEAATSARDAIAVFEEKLDATVTALAALKNVYAQQE